MRRIFILFIFLIPLAGCKVRVKEGGRLIREINPQDTVSFYFSGMLNPVSAEFYDCTTDHYFDYEIGVDNLRSISKKIAKNTSDNTQAIFCKLKGRFAYSQLTNKKVLVIEGTLDFSPLESCTKPPLPALYTADRGYTLKINEDYTYHISNDGKSLESGNWAKNYEFKGIMMWNSPNDIKREYRNFTIEYMVNSAIITFYLDDEFLIFR